MSDHSMISYSWPHRAPLHQLAVRARTVGHYRLGPGRADHVRTIHFTKLLWSVSGTGTMISHGKKSPIGPNTLAVHFPGDLHHVVNEGAEPWEHCWWTFDGELAVPLVHSLGFTATAVYPARPVPEQLFKKLVEAFSHVDGTSEIRATAVAFELLSAAAEAKWLASQMQARVEPSEEFRKSALAILQQSWSRPGFGVDEFADAVGMHRSTFSRRFRAMFGLSPSSYLQRWRVKNALIELKSTQTPVHDIARNCGWDDPGYFARCIRKATGLSPLQFRNSP
ncbi:MAG TPA: AraC family transcriptional regulator [Chthoniobacteraceae bacterium]|nr:AraC family transcriptional regulator [Chthoniobacteraceae bacterium]